MNSLVKNICPGPVIPALRTYADFQWAAANCAAPAFILLFGDINILPGMLTEAKRHGKRLIVHLDLLEGIGRDKAGIKCLARLGVTALITTKSQLVKAAKEEGMVVIQRVFLMDSESFRNAIKLLGKLKPDAIEVLPASVPAWVFEQLTGETGLPVLAGGLINSAADVTAALKNGAAAVSTSQRELW